MKFSVVLGASSSNSSTRIVPLFVSITAVRFAMLSPQVEFPAKAQRRKERAPLHPAPCLFLGVFAPLREQIHVLPIMNCSIASATPSSVFAAVGCRPPISRSERSEEHTSELQSLSCLVCRLLL